MLRTIHPTATAIRARRDILTPAAFSAFALVILAGCGDSKTPDKTAENSPPRSAAPAVVTATTPAVDSGSLIPENISYEQAEAAYTGRRYGEAAAMFAAYTSRRPENPWGHYMLGLSAWKAGEREKAESAFVKALERDPRHVKSLLNLSRVLLEMNRANDALTRVTAALELDPESSDGHRLMGRVRSALGQTDEALESYRQALSLDEKDVWSMNNMGLLLIRQERFEEALAPLARATQLEGDVAVFQNNLGIALERTGHFAQAAEAYRAALAADSGYANAKASLARVDQHVEGSDGIAADLVALSDSFAADVLRWREERVAAASSESADSTPLEEPDGETPEPEPTSEPKR